MSVVEAPVKKAAVKKIKPQSAKPKATKKAPVKTAKFTPEAPFSRTGKTKPEAKAKPEPKGKKPVVAKATKPGRPPGPLHVPNWIEGLKSTAYSRTNSLVRIEGLGSLYLRASAEGAPALQNLAKLVESKDPRLVKLLK